MTSLEKMTEKYKNGLLFLNNIIIKNWRIIKIQKVH